MIELSVPQLERVQEQLKDIPEKIPVVIARAINRAAEAARTEGSRFIRETYHVKHSSVLRKIKIKKAYPADLVADIRVTGRPLSVINFKVRANKPLPVRGKYAVVRVKKGGGGPISGSFVLTTKTGYTNVFTRKTKERFPLRSIHGPSVPQMMGHEEGLKRMEDKAREVLDKRLDHEISRVLGDRS